MSIPCQCHWLFCWLQSCNSCSIIYLGQEDRVHGNQQFPVFYWLRLAGWGKNQQAVSCAGCYFVWLFLYYYFVNHTKCVCVCVCVCVHARACMCGSSIDSCVSDQLQLDWLSDLFPRTAFTTLYVMLVSKLSGVITGNSFIRAYETAALYSWWDGWNAHVVLDWGHQFCSCLPAWLVAVPSDHPCVPDTISTDDDEVMLNVLGCPLTS